MAVRALCLCDGYGGMELGLRLAGVQLRTVGRVERDSYAAAVLVARMEESALDRAPVWDDLTTFDSAAWRGCVDLVTAGFPCQPWSLAGSKSGVDDERWLWPKIASIIRDVGPRAVFLENVPALNGNGPSGGGLPHVLQSLADLGFDAEWGLLSAADVGATHKRQRFWLLALAHADGDGYEAFRRQCRGEQPRDDPDGSGSSDVADPDGARLEAPAIADRATPGITGPRRHSFPPPPDDDDGWRRWSADGGPQPGVRRRTDGRPLGLADALHLGGNGLVPQVAAEAFTRLLSRFEES